MNQAIDAVLAGTKGFAVALLAPLTARVGNRPRVAGDPGQVLGLCSGPSALAVVEFLGEGSLLTIKALVRDGRGLRIVAAVPIAHAAAEGTLRALGVEVGRWDGKTDGVISAVDRVVAAMSGAPAPARPQQPVAAAGPSRPPSPGIPKPPAAPPPPSLTRAPAAPSPAAARPGTPAQAPVPRPAGSPAAPRPPAAPAPRAPAPPPAARPASPASPAAQAVPRPAAPSAAPSAPRPPAAAPQPARPAATFFDDLDSDVSVDVDDLPTAASPSVDFHTPGVYVPAPVAAAVDWPAGAASAAQAEDALKRAIAGEANPAHPLHALAVKTLDALSDLERSVLAGEPQPIDTAPVRKAAVMRLRVADALASAPPSGANVDQAALSAILGEIDGLLAEAASLLGSAPAELGPALEAIRNSLVSEAIDFSEAAQRVAAQAAPAPAEAKHYSTKRAAQARVLSVGTDVDAGGSGKQWRLIVALVLAIAAAAGYQAYRRFGVKATGFPSAVSNTPRNMQGVGPGAEDKTGPVVIVPTGKVDRAELERFKEQLEQQGKQVLERNGTIVVVPAPSK